MNTMEQMRVSPDHVPQIMNVLGMIRRRRRRAHAPILILLILGAVLVSPLRTLLEGNTARFVATAVFLWLAYALILERVAGLLCPRCGRPFHSGRSYRNDFARRCMQCGLRLDGANVLDEYRVADPMLPDYRKTGPR